MEQAVSKTSMLKFCIMLRSSEWSNHEGCWQVILELAQIMKDAGKSF